MRSLLISSVLAALLSTTAIAGNVIIENEYVKAGVNETSGTFGSGGNTRPGLQYDSTGTSTFPADSAQGDYLTPGSPFDGFTVNVDGTAYTNNNGGASAIAGNGWTGTPTTNSATWSGGVSSVFDITNTYSLPSGQEYIDITTAITAQTAITTLRFGRFIDPDAMPETGDTSATDNVLGYGTIPAAHVVFSEATVSRYALGLYSTDSNVGAGISSRWSTDPNDYATGGDYAVGNGDHTIGLGWEWTGLTAGDIVTASYAYIFGPSAFDAATSAITGGAGGGVDITTGALEDVGSATDAASGPTVVGSASSTVTTHAATETATTQTIARSTLTSTWDVYSDASLGTPVVVTTDPGSFVGSINQINNTQTMQNMSTRGLDFDSVTIVNSNASNGKTSGFVIGNAKELDNGTTVGAGIGRLATNTTNADGSADASSTILNLNGDKKVQGGTVSVDLTHGMMDLTTTRTIGDFANAGTTSGTDTSVGIRFIADGEKVRPVVGYTRGRTTVGGYTETGSIQSARTVADTTDYYGYATIGAQVTLASGLDVQALRHTDGVNVLSLDFDKEWGENKSFNLGVNRTLSDLGNSTSISAGIQIKF